MCVQYIGGVQYIVWIPWVHRGISWARRGISWVGEQVSKNFSISIENPDVLNIPRCTHDIPQCTHGIPRCTQGIPHMHHDIPPDVLNIYPPMYWTLPPPTDELNIPLCAKHTLYRVVILIIHITMLSHLSPENSPKSHNFFHSEEVFLLRKTFDRYLLLGSSLFFSQKSRAF